MPTPDYNPLCPFLSADDRDRHYAAISKECHEERKEEVKRLKRKAEKFPLTSSEIARLKAFTIYIKDYEEKFGK